MKLQELKEMAKPIDDSGTWDDDMDIYHGLGKLWHLIQVQASYTHHGPYDREMSLEPIAYNFDDDEAIDAMLQELENRGKIIYDRQGGTVKIAPDTAERQMQSREQMGKVVDQWNKTGRPFTFGT